VQAPQPRVQLSRARLDIRAFGNIDQCDRLVVLVQPTDHHGDGEVDGWGPRTSPVQEVVQSPGVKRLGTLGSPERERATHWVSTRKVDDLLKALGMNGMSKSEVSRICVELDGEIEAFRNRPITEGLRKALSTVLSGASWQRCRVALHAEPAGDDSALGARAPWPAIDGRPASTLSKRAGLHVSRE
jgi:hypothetical protein